MSDFEQQLPPAPPAPPAFGAPQPSAPFGAPGAPVPPPAPGWYVPPGVGGYPLPAVAVKPPRPRVLTGSVLLLVGSVLLVAGSFMNWVKVDGSTLSGFGLELSFNGFGTDGDTKDGPVFVFFAVVLAAFGLTMLIARKVLAVAILSVVFGLLAVAAAAADLADVSDYIDTLKGLGITGKVGPGLPVVLVGALVATAGGIATVAARRKP